MSQLFPKEIIENSQEKNFSSHATGTRILYVFLLVVAFTGMGLLPLIKVDVGVRGHGMIRPAMDAVPVHTPVSGYIRKWAVSENRYVRESDLIAVLESPETSERIRLNKLRTERVSSFLDDLTLLIGKSGISSVNTFRLETPRYQQSLQELQQQLFIQQLIINNLQERCNRKKKLYASAAASRAEVEAVCSERDNSSARYQLLIKQQKKRWSTDRESFLEEKENLESERVHLLEEQKRYRIHSPITGTMQNVLSANHNSFVHSNEVLAEISPDTILIAEVYVTSADIGLLGEGMSVRLQVDAFNHHEWGLLHGTVLSISENIQMRNEQFYFTLRCSLDRNHLEFSNEIRKRIKKGMTVQARFIISRRSLFQLLHDKVDDWINPLWNDNVHDNTPKL